MSTTKQLTVLTGTSTDSNWNVFIKVLETVNLDKHYTAIRTDVSVQNISTEKITLKGSYKINMSVNNQVRSDGSEKVDYTFSPTGSLYYATLMWNDVSHYDYINNNKTIPITCDVTFTGEDDTSFSITLNTDIALTPLESESNKILTEMTEEDIKAVNEGSVAIRTKIIVKADSSHDEEIILTEEDAVKDWEYTDEKFVPENGFIGQFVSRTLTGNLQNISDDFNIEDREIQLLLGIVKLGSRYDVLATENGDAIIDEYGNQILIKDLGEDDTTWYQLGNFFITKPEDDEVADNTSFESFDYAVSFNDDFNADYKSAAFPMSFNDTITIGRYFTAEQLAQYTCEQVGVDFGNTEFTNSTFHIESNQFTEGNSCRDVMKNISQLAYGWCGIDWDNKCYIYEPKIDYDIPSYNIITNDNYYSLTTQKNKYGPINKVVVGMSMVEGEATSVEDLESISKNGLTEIDILDNPITYTEELRASVIDKASNLFGLQYIPFEAETPGHPWLKGNELISIVDMEGNTKYTFAFNRTINYTGHIKTTLAVSSETKQARMKAYSRSLYKDIKTVTIKVDKQEGVIDILNSNVRAYADGLSSLENRFDMEITDSYSKQEIQEILKGIAEDGTVVETVKSAAGTFDMNGLTIEQSDAETATNINADGMKIYNKTSSSDDTLLVVNSNGVDAKNVKVATYLNIGAHSRVEDYVHTDYTVGTGVFWIGSDD